MCRCETGECAITPQGVQRRNDEKRAEMLILPRNNLFSTSRVRENVLYDTKKMEDGVHGIFDSSDWNRKVCLR
jgi:hypothetical protein